MKLLKKNGEMIMKTIYKQIKHFKYQITRGLESLIYFLPTIWKFRDWDYTYVWEMELAAIRRLRLGIEKRGSHIGYERYVRQMKDCEYLLKRLIDDNYLTDMNKTFPKFNHQSYIHAKYMYEQDIAYLNKLKTKYMNHWWD